jgi:ATP-dependent helicase/nuclease subunit A
VDFNDLEHEALKVLIVQDEQGFPVVEDDSFCYTDAADELSRMYDEVLVDEYQDSNLVQEALIQAISGERFGRPDVFMVGDVKQSIYKFRLARPELFLEKYHHYNHTAAEKDSGTMIELHQNFRSRAEVLEGINDVFYHIMTENMGNIRYTEDAALHAGAKFEPLPETSDSEQSQPDRPTQESLFSEEDDSSKVESSEHASDKRFIPELYMVDTGSDAMDGLDDDAADYTAKEIEAKLIAGKIREMTDPETGIQVWDKTLGESGGYRLAQYRDIVILLRSTTGWTENILSVLMNENIPAYAESRMGYFNTLEVETILSFLAVIDNPMQDIPLTAVLHSPIVGLNEEQLAHLMAEYNNCTEKGQDRGIYAALRHFLHKDEDEEELYQRLTSFESMLTRFREESRYLPIHELLYRVYERTGYYHYVSAMPGGQTRQANLDMLVEKAAAYEKTSYKGLFHFIRYIQNLKKYDTDFGEASTLGENDNTVRLMSIHKSKGLEFPIVFLAGMGKRFNKQDVYSRILIDPELGIGTDYLNLEYRVKTSTLKKNVLRRKMDLDNLGEELRVLYVAMTRAKEHLIMTATDRSLEKKLEMYAPGAVDLTDHQIPYTILSTASSYLDWVLMAASAARTQIRIEEVPIQSLMEEEVSRQLINEHTKSSLIGLDLTRTYHENFREMLEKHLNYTYPHKTDITLHTKMSVSELKKQGQMVDEAESERPYTSLPHTASADGKADRASQPVEAGKHFSHSDDTPPDDGYGATRGTAYHRALELLPFHEVHTADEIRICLENMVSQKRYTKESLDMIDPAVIERFLSSSLGKCMAEAQCTGRLHKEQQFVMGVPANEMGDYDSKELVVVQGIIDAWFEEEDGLVLVDYKTDKTRSVRTLLGYYKTQIDYYAKALEQMTGKKVKEKMIYSLTMQKEIPCG